MIPKKIHNIWFGSKLNEGYSNLWMKLNPECKIHLWTDDNINTLDHPLVEYIKLTNCFVMKSDLARLAIMDKIGGLYADIDLKPYYPIPKEFFNFKSIAPYENEMLYSNWICNALIMSEPGSKFIKLVIDKILSLGKNKFKKLAEIYRADQLTGPALYTYIYRHNPDCELTVIPSNYVVPEDFRSAYTCPIKFVKEIINRKSLGYDHHEPIVIIDKGDDYITDADKTIIKYLRNYKTPTNNEENQFTKLLNKENVS